MTYPTAKLHDLIIDTIQCTQGYVDHPNIKILDGIRRAPCNGWWKLKFRLARTLDASLGLKILN